MSITHDEARRLLQLKADDARFNIDQYSLDAHLRTCLECQKYAAKLRELELALPTLLHNRWDRYPLPLSINKSVFRKPIDIKQNIFFATRILAMGMIFIAFLFNIWQFSQSGRQGPNPSSNTVPLIPTPAAQSTMTKNLDQNCEPILYEIGQDDTLTDIAEKFSVSADEILRVNHLKTSTLPRTISLSIPVCSPTPSGTPNTISGTFTPILGTTTLTPADSPTQ